MPLRVCVLTRETALHWAAYYLAAFRESCEVISIGPAWNPEDADNFAEPSYVAPSIVKNDIISTATDASELLNLLPPGWNPDLLVTIQSGAPPVGEIERVGCPTVYLSIDTWHDPREFVVARQYNFVFLAQKALVKYMRKAGCRHAYWLPLACDPAAHYLIPGEVTHDFAFVGRYHFVANRQRVGRLRALAEHFSVGVYSGLDARDMAQAYGTARVVFNASIAKDVNMRVFEALPTGKLLLTNREAEANGLFDLFEDERHLITFSDDDLLIQAQRCLEDPEWARAIGEAGRKEVLEKHTYRHRVHALQETLQSFIPALGGRVYSRLKAGIRLIDLIPFGAQRLLDVGLALEASKTSLRRAGIERVTGVTPSETLREQRGGAYDEIAVLSDVDSIPGGEFDAIIWNAPSVPELDWSKVFTLSTARLAEGGSLLLVIEDAALEALLGHISVETLENWLIPRGYIFQIRRPAGAETGPNVIVARQWSALVEEVVAAMYNEFPTNGELPGESGPEINEAGPDSLDVEHP